MSRVYLIAMALSLFSAGLSIGLLANNCKQRDDLMGYQCLRSHSVALPSGDTMRGAKGIQCKEVSP